MKYSLAFLAASLLLIGTTFAQEPAADDPVGKQAAALEAELGKYKDTTPEAAEAMIKLVDLYHGDGRLFGLVRVAQTFVADRSTDLADAVANGIGAWLPLIPIVFLRLRPAKP